MHALIKLVSLILDIINMFCAKLIDDFRFMYITFYILETNNFAYNMYILNIYIILNI